MWVFLWVLPDLGLLNPALTSYLCGNIQNTEKFAHPHPAQNIHAIDFWVSFIVSVSKRRQNHLTGGRIYFGSWI